MQLTAKQEEGLKIALQRWQNGEKYTVIAGYAGTGKSTLVKYIIDEIHRVQPRFRVCYATFTGKAAEVLRKKGNENCCTLHRLLYYSHMDKQGNFHYARKKDLDCEIVVVDEVSMAPREMIAQLFSHNCYVLCLGDPFQLPPINKDEDNHLLDHPHIFLDEIMRQATESSIIRLTMDIRAGKPIKPYQDNEIRIYNKSDFTLGMALWADEVLCATNNTRTKLNNDIRAALGHGPQPEDGDKLVCLHNYWDTETNINFNPLINGSIGYLQNPKDKIILPPRFIHPITESYTVINATVTTEDKTEMYKDIQIDKSLLIENKKTLPAADEYRFGKIENKFPDLIPKEFAYGYAITRHKRQGSEWDKVLVIEENFPFNKIEHARWLYTACTRASQKLVLIRS